MTNQELLEYAAKAVWGYFPTKSTERGVQIGLYSWWNPLTSDADAFKLQVLLRMDIVAEDDWVQALCWDRQMPIPAVAEATEDITVDDRASTRRAIVRAAAELGKRMIGEEDGDS